MAEGTKKGGLGGLLESAKGAALYGLVEGIAKETWEKGGGKKKVQDTLKSQVLGIGPNDKALYNEVKAYLPGDTTIKIKRLDKFVKDLTANGYSFWWFRNVIARMHQGYKGEDKGKSPAVKIVDLIINEDNFNERVEVAGPSLVVPTWHKKVGNVWEGVEVFGRKIVVFTEDKFSKIDWCAISDTIEEGANEFKQGFINPTRGNKSWCFWILVTFIVAISVGFLVSLATF